MDEKVVLLVINVILFVTISIAICSTLVMLLAFLWFGHSHNRQLKSFFALGCNLVFLTLFSSFIAIADEKHYPLVYAGPNCQDH